MPGLVVFFYPVLRVLELVFGRLIMIYIGIAYVLSDRHSVNENM